MDLTNLRCPHNWGFHKFNDKEDDLITKKDSLAEEFEEFDTKYASQVSRFFVFSLLSYEAYRKEKYTEALENIEKTLVTDDFMKKYEKVFKHVYQASKVHILYKMNSIDKANEIYWELQKETFNEVEEAGFKYVQGNFLSYYVKDGYEKTIELIESAINEVKDEAEFHYLLANVLGKIRHFQFPPPPPSEKEFDACIKAVSLRKDIALYSLQLAKLYMDARYSCTYERRAKYTNFATSLFKNLLKNIGSLSGNDISRCFFYLMKAKFDPDLEEYVKKARKKSNSVLTNHYSGKFYIRNCQYEEALDCFNNISCVLPYICGETLLLMYRVNGDSLSDDEIEVAISKWNQAYETSNGTDLFDFHMNISMFFLLVMNDFIKALDHFILASSTGIMKPCLTSLTKNYIFLSYHVVLKNALSAKSLQNNNEMEKINEVLSIIKKYPQRPEKKKVPSLLELQRNLF